MSKNQNKKILNSNIYDDNLSDNLSDELNYLINNKSKDKEIKNKEIKDKEIKDKEIKDKEIKDKEIKDKDKESFDITNIFNDINYVLGNYKNCKITGEVLSFKISDSNAWINIKSDNNYQLTCVFWKIDKDKNYLEYKSIKSGDKINFIGKFGIMKKNLNIYFNINLMEKFGKGDYLDIYDKYRIKIKELNLRIPKKNLSIFPYTIGIITALEGAAIQDILQTLKLDKFIGNIIIKNSIVQGNQCSKSLINSIEWFESNYSSNEIDILMITRGGGSWDDLVGFSDWDLLMKLSNIKFITLSAVGHQIDNQLTDEICDYKFATPSIGAKFIVETQQKYKNYITKYNTILNTIINTYNNSKKNFDLITNNYSNIIKKYDLKEIMFQVKKYSNQINLILMKYNNLKNNFYSKLANLKPTIIRKNELTSIEDFIDTNTGIEIKSKKIEIYFIDGKIKLSYKIIDYEKFN
jgi:exodeoxyribonuclease VII large subunit